MTKEIVLTRVNVEIPIEKIRKVGIGYLKFDKELGINKWIVKTVSGIYEYLEEEISKGYRFNQVIVTQNKFNYIFNN